MAVETGIAPQLIADCEPSLLSAMLEYMKWRAYEMSKANQGR